MLRLPLRYFDMKRIAENNSFEITTLPDSSSYIMIRKRAIEEKGFVVEQEIPFQEYSLKLKNDKERDESCIFGTLVRENGKDLIKKPGDPMADLIGVKGNPEEVALECHNRGKVFVFLSVFLVLTDIVINFIIIFFLLRYFIR
jgi:hypothetical protein